MVDVETLTAENVSKEWYPHNSPRGGHQSDMLHWTNRGLTDAVHIDSLADNNCSVAMTMDFLQMHIEGLWCRNQLSHIWISNCITQNIVGCTWWRYQMETSSALLAICAGNFQGHWRGALMFSLICTWINHWVNNGEAGDFRRYRTHYDIIVMNYRETCLSNSPHLVSYPTFWVIDFIAYLNTWLEHVRKISVWHM